MYIHIIYYINDVLNNYLKENSRILNFLEKIKVFLWINVSTAPASTQKLTFLWFWCHINSGIDWETIEINYSCIDLK